MFSAAPRPVRHRRIPWRAVVAVRLGLSLLAGCNTLDEQQRKWIFQRPMPALSLRVTTAPLIDNKHVLAGFPNGKLIAVNHQTFAVS